MKKNRTNLSNVTVVITGATSGIGKAASYAFARENANLVLASRTDSLLQELASECEALGANAIAVESDVSHKESIKHLFETTLAFFGTVDVWINNAGVGAIGEVEKTPLEIHEQVIRTNLLGPLIASYYVIPYFKKRGHGIMINTNSTGAFVGHPYTAAYSASKFGLRGLSEALRFELKDYKDIHICDLFSSFVDTPAITKHAANFLGKEIKFHYPLIPVEKMAETMVNLAYRPREAVHIGLSDRLARLVHSVAPGLTGKIMNRIETKHFRKARDTPLTQGNVLGPEYTDTLH